MAGNQMILAENQVYSLDCHATQLNNNVLVVGASGSGKTRGIVTPNLLQATGSYLVSDPKGNLYEEYGPYLERRGYEVKKLDFTNPMDSIHYNPFCYIHCTQDIVKVAHMLIYQRTAYYSSRDPFWDEASVLLLESLISLIVERLAPKQWNLHNLQKLVDACEIEEDNANKRTPLDLMMEKWGREKPDSYAVSQYTKFRIAASRTLRSILISVNARLGTFDTPEIRTLLADDSLDIPSLGRKKKAVFVVVSDTDRSLDGLVNLFFTQAMNELCRYADRECKHYELPVPVRFILDDFATNCRIDEFPRMISSIRSRGISTMLMIQAESQLANAYGQDGKTIIGNCDTYVYLGGNDIDTAYEVARRCDVPLQRILYMPVGTSWIFRRGQKPIHGKNLTLESYIKWAREQQLNEQTEVERSA